MIDPYRAGVVLEVGGGDAGAQVTPFADDGIAQVTVMPLIGMTKEHGVLDLAPRRAARSERCRAIDLRSHFNGRTLAGGEWSADHGSFHDLGIARDVDRAG